MTKVWKILRYPDHEVSRVTQARETGKYDQDMTFPFWGGRAWATTPLVFSLINDLGLMLTSKKIIMSG